MNAWKIDDLFIQVTVHKTDTVSIAVSCSYKPVIMDISGIISFSNALTRVEERISTMIEQIPKSGQNEPCKQLVIPRHNDWKVIMWHFGADTITEYSGKDFCVSWEIAENCLIRVYTKNMKGSKNRIRIEKQEYPGKPLYQALEEKLNLRNEGV